MLRTQYTFEILLDDTKIDITYEQNLNIDKKILFLALNKQFDKIKKNTNICNVELISSKFDDSDTIHEIIDCIYCRQITIKTLIISCQILNLIDENHFKLLGEIVSKIMDIICTNIIDYSNIDKFVKYLPYFKRIKMISGDTFTGNENNEHTNLIINDTYAILIGSLLNSDEINLHP